MKPLCSICGDRHEGYQAHVWPASNVVVNASNTASNAINNASNRPSHATNGDAGRAVEFAGDSSKASPDRMSIVGKGGGETSRRKQRWTREAYNAYQREYMRKRRAK